MGCWLVNVTEEVRCHAISSKLKDRLDVSKNLH